MDTTSGRCAGAVGCGDSIGLRLYDMADDED
jgi:hypothetical protein